MPQTSVSHLTNMLAVLLVSACKDNGGGIIYRALGVFKWHGEKAHSH